MIGSGQSVVADNSRNRALAMICLGAQIGSCEGDLTLPPTRAAETLFQMQYTVHPIAFC